MTRYVIIGAGGIGCAIGGRLQWKQKPVVATARGPQLEALRAGPLALNNPEERIETQLDVHASPSDFDWGEDDVVILCAKSQDTAAAMAAVAEVASLDTPIVCAQNGITNEEVVRRLGFRRVYGAFVFTPVTFVSPGRVTVHTAPDFGVVDVGVHPAGPADDVVTTLTADLCEAGFDSQPDEDIIATKRGKLLGNLGNVVQALGARDALRKDFVDDVVAEGVACFEAAGLKFAAVDQIRARAKGVKNMPVDGAPRPGGSTWQSMARGRFVETPYLNGEIVRLGLTLGIPTPLNAALTALALEPGPPARYDAATLARLLDERTPS